MKIFEVQVIPKWTWYAYHSLWHNLLSYWENPLRLWVMTTTYIQHAYPAICMDIQTHPNTYSRFLVKTSFYYLHHHQRHGNSSFFLVYERIILKVCCTENISILYTTLARDAWIYANKYKDVKTSVVWGCAWGNYISKLHHTAS